MKKKMAVLVLGAFLVTGLFGCGNKVPADTVATVNGEPISQEELDTNYNQVLLMYQQMYGLEITEDSMKIDIRNDILDSLILRKLSLQEAEKRELSVSDEEVEEMINSTAERYGTMEDLQAAVEQAGMTMDYYREFQIKENMLLDKLQEDIINNPEPADIIRASHILVETEEEANDIIAQLDNGADFAALAQEKSTDTASAVNGGDLGYFSVGNGSTIPMMMVQPFTDGANALEIGEYSKTPVVSEFGYHIILVSDKQTGVNLLEDAETYGSILATIYNQGLNTLANNLYEKAKADDKVKILLDTTSVPETVTAGDNNNPEDNSNEDNSNEPAEGDSDANTDDTDANDGGEAGAAQ